MAPSTYFSIVLGTLYSGLPGGETVRNHTFNTGDWGSISGSGRSLSGKNGNPLQYSCLWRIPWTEEPAGYSSQGPRVKHD